MGEQTVNLSFIVAYAIPIIGMAVSIFTFYASVRERHQKTAAEQAKIGIKLDANAKTLEEIKETIDDLRQGYHDNHEAITKLETKVTGLEGRVKRVETNLKELESRVHDFHTH